jgi:hypothetical protein
MPIDTLTSFIFLKTYLFIKDVSPLRKKKEGEGSGVEEDERGLTNKGERNA